MQMIAYLLTAALLGSTAMAEGTRLASDGKVLFEATQRVTFGASYSAHAVRATVAAPAATTVKMRVEKTPRNLFLNGERLDTKAWQFADSMVVLPLAAGTSEVQIRFDDVTSLKPVTHKVPLIVIQDGQRRTVADVPVTVGNGKAQGTLSWPGPAGFFQAVAKRNGKEAPAVSVGVREAPAAQFDGRPAFYLEENSSLVVSADAPDYVLPVDMVELSIAAVCCNATKADKKTLDWDGSVVVEGEAFAGEGGGEIVISKEHQNTHGGACAYSWAKPGHWLEWNVELPKAGNYLLTIVGASQETTVLRSALLDGKPLPGAGVIRMAGTGGWGRSNPDEWQPFQPVDGTGKVLQFQLAKGKHVLRLTNLVGQHFNVDAILFTPVP